jgi:hypothetical protein
VAGAAALTTGLILGVNARNSERVANQAQFDSEAYSSGERAKAQANLANLGFGLATTAALAAGISYLLEAK